MSMTTFISSVTPPTTWSGVLCGRMPGVHARPKVDPRRIGRARDIPASGSMASAIEPARAGAGDGQPHRRRDAACAVRSTTGWTRFDRGSGQGRALPTWPIEPLWQRWNAAAASRGRRGGERILDVHCAWGKSWSSANTRARRTSIIIVSHAEPIRAALMH